MIDSLASKGSGTPTNTYITVNHPLLRWVLFGIFTLSGFSGLIYESIWSHYLKLMLGHAAYAQTLVLAIFMGGMALGAWLVSCYSHRWDNLLLGYAFVEGVIGLLGLTFHVLFTTLTDLLYLSWIPALGDPGIINTLKWSLAALLILPQSVLLGATFPLMSSGIIRLYPTAPGATLAMLYFTNSLGAAVGVLVSVFVLIPAVGLPGTIMTAGLLNILLALVVWGLAKARSIPAPLENTFAASQARYSPLVMTLLAIALGSSLASFFYEIGWVRMLSLILGSSTQAFELMLSAFILGLALGGLWIRRRLDRIAIPLRYAGYVQVLMGLCALGTLPLYNSGFDFMAFMIGGLSKTDGGYTLFNIFSQTIAMMIMLPATFLAGMTLPLFTYALLQHGMGEGSIGRVYSANTVGAIIGVLLAVHVVMPAIGVKGLVSLGACLDILAGLALLALTRPHWRWRLEMKASASAAALVFAAIFLTVHFDTSRMASGVYRTGKSTIDAAATVSYYQHGKTASIARIAHKDGYMSLSTNGKPDAAIETQSEKGGADEITMVMLAVLPLALQPEAKTVANIGLGSGMTTHNLLGASRLERVDTVEIEQAMIEGARGFGPLVERTFNDPRSHIYIDDAKTYFSSRNARYDIIISEPSNPWVSGVASLFSEEFYRYIKNHLNKRGLLVQWLQLYESNPALVSSVFRALTPHFQDYVVFNTDNGNIVIIATNGGDLKSLDSWPFAEPQLQDQLRRVNLRSIQDMQIRRLGDKALLQPVFASLKAPANSDFFPYLSLHAPKSRYLGESAITLGKIHLAPLPVLEMLDGYVRASETTATPTPFFVVPDFQQMADRIIQTILGSPSTDDKLGPLAIDLQLLARELTVSAPQQPADKLVRSILFQVAEAVNPHSPASRVVPFWDYLVNQPGYNTLSELTHDWIALHQAIGSRDASHMATLAARLIKALPKENLSDQEANYLLAAGLLAHLAMGNKANAGEFLKNFLNQQKPIAQPSFYLEFLLQHLAYGNK